MIGIIPAAGEATRMGGIPKMLLPTPSGILIDLLLTRMRLAAPRAVLIGASEPIYSVLRSKYPYENERESQTHLWEFSKHRVPTMSATVSRLGEVFHQNENAIFGMPDTFFEDENAFVKLADELAAGADVAVGVFETRPEQRSKLGMCLVDFERRVIDVMDKPQETIRTQAWGVLAWKPVFWHCIDAAEPHIGYALQKAVKAGLSVRAVKMDGGYWDCGTPAEYFDLITYLHEKAET